MKRRFSAFAVKWKKKLMQIFQDSEKQESTGTKKRELIHHQFNLFNKRECNWLGGLKGSSLREKEVLKLEPFHGCCQYFNII